MAGIFTRKAILSVLNNADLTPEERTDQLYSLYGRAIDDCYVTKAAAETAKTEAVAAALKDAPKPQEVNVKDSDDYKALEADFAKYKTRQEARQSDDFKGIKGKFFDTVYDCIDRGEKAKPIAEQLAALRKDFEEYFEAAADSDPDPKPQGHPVPYFGAPTEGGAPSGKDKPSFGDAWGFVPKKS